MEPVSMGALAALGGISLAGQLGGALIGASAQKDALRAQYRMQQAQMKRLDDAYNELSPYYKGILDQLPIQDRIQALQNFTGIDMTDFGAYNPAEAPKAWLDPSIAYQQQQAQQSIQAAQAARGGLKSGGALKELQDRAQNIAMMGWQNAQTASYQDYLNRFNAAKQKNADAYTNLSNLANMSINAQANLANLRTGNVSQANAISQQMGQTQGELAGLWGSAVGQAVGGTFSPQNVGAFYQAMQHPSIPATNYNAYGQTMMEPTPYTVPSTQQSGINPYFTGSSQYFNPNEAGA